MFKENGKNPNKAKVCGPGVSGKAIEGVEDLKWKNTEFLSVSTGGGKSLTWKI